MDSDAPLDGDPTPAGAIVGRTFATPYDGIPSSAWSSPVQRCCALTSGAASDDSPPPSRGLEGRATDASRAVCARTEAGRRALDGGARGFDSADTAINHAVIGGTREPRCSRSPAPRAARCRGCCGIGWQTSASTAGTTTCRSLVARRQPCAGSAARVAGVDRARRTGSCADQSEQLEEIKVKHWPNTSATPE